MGKDNKYSIKLKDKKDLVNYCIHALLLWIAMTKEAFGFLSIFWILIFASTMDLVIFT
jgi:hypothetical protein